MKKIKSIAIILLSFGVFMQLSSCGKTTKAKPVSEILKAVFFAQQVKHDNTVVYTKGAANNTVSGYSKLKIDLSSATAVSFTDFDGNVFNGSYSLSADSKSLIFSNLTPIPTGSGGTITFSIVSFQESPAQVVLSRAGASVKTGNTINEYTLITSL
jgi:predicted lactoylglutathione lyase